MNFVYKNKKSIPVEKFYLYAIGLAITNASFYASIYIIIIQKYIQDIYKISLLIAIFNIAKVISDIPFGILADRFGSLFIFVVSKIFNLLSVLILIYSKEYYSFAISMFLFGLHKSSFVGKAESYMFGYLTKKKQIHIFSKIVPLYYGFIDIVSFFTILISTYISIKFNNSVNIILYISAVYIFCSIFYIHTLESVKTFKKNNNENRTFLKEILNISVKTFYLIKTEKPLKYFILYFGLVKMVGWNIIELCILYIQNKSYYKPHYIAVVKMSLEIIMSLGSFLAIIIASKISFKKSCFILLSIFSTLSLIPFINHYQFILIISSTTSYLLIYCVCEVIGERNIEKICSKEVRSTIMSVSTTFASLLGSIAVLFFGKIGSILGIQFSNISFYFIPIICIIYLICKTNQFKNVK